MQVCAAQVQTPALVVIGFVFLLLPAHRPAPTLVRGEQPLHLRASQGNVLERVDAVLDIWLDLTTACVSLLLPLHVTFRLRAPTHPLRCPIRLPSLALVRARRALWWCGKATCGRRLSSCHTRSAIPLAVGGRCAEMGQPATRMRRRWGVSANSAMRRMPLRRRWQRMRRVGWGRAEMPRNW